MPCRGHPYGGGASSPRLAGSAGPGVKPSQAPHPSMAAQGYCHVSPDPLTRSLMDQAAVGQWAGWASGGAATSGSPRTLPRAPSSEADATSSWAAFPDDRAFEDGASTLLAAAAEVDSVSAAEAEAAVDAALAAGGAAAARTTGTAAAAGAAAQAPGCAAASGSEGSGEHAALALTKSAASVKVVAAAGSAPGPHTPTQAACPPVLPVASMPAAAVPAWALALSRSPGASQLVGATQVFLLRTLVTALQRGSSQGAP